MRSLDTAGTLNPKSHRLQEGNVVYHQLLRAELLGVPPVPPSPEKPSPGGGGDARASSSPMTSPVKKMFRYKSGDRCRTCRALLSAVCLHFGCLHVAVPT